MQGAMWKHSTFYLRYDVIIDGCHTIDEHDESQDGSRRQHPRVESQPCKVQADLLAIIRSDVVQRLFLVEVFPVGPVDVE